MSAIKDAARTLGLAGDNFDGALVRATQAWSSATESWQDDSAADFQRGCWDPMERLAHGVERALKELAVTMQKAQRSMQ